MALVVIKLRDDDEDGKVELSMESEPPLNTRDGEEHLNTAAQAMAVRMLNAALRSIDPVDFYEVVR